MAMIYPFMQKLREAQFPAPGHTVEIKSFIPESGTEVRTKSFILLKTVNLKELFSSNHIKMLSHFTVELHSESFLLYLVKRPLVGGLKPHFKVYKVYVKIHVDKEAFLDTVS